MAAAAAIDSAKIDSLFIARALAFYDAANDSANAFTWRKICTVRTPGDADCWFKYASGLYDRHDTTGAMDAIRHLIQLHPESGRGQIVLANWFRAAGQTDSSLVYAKAAMTADTSWRPQAAQMYMAAGYAAFQAKDYPHAIDLLGQAQPWAAPANAPTIAFLLGSSQFQMGLPVLTVLQAYKVTPTVKATVDSACALSKTILGDFTPAQTNVAAGASVSRDAANQMLTYMGNVTTALAPMRTRLKCAP